MPQLLEVENLVKTYYRRRLAGPREEVRALDGVSFSISCGTTLAIVGESGSGKSTLAFCLACLEKPASGTIRFEESEILQLDEKELRGVRPKIQLIFQDPASSLNPRWRVLEILAEPLVLQGKLSRDEMRSRAHALLEQVGLSSNMEEKLPSELSGGQRQRLAIARALMLAPKLLILDEALSALDCSVQAQIANLLVELQNSLGMTYLFITHDMAMATHLADEIAVMNEGRIVEQGAPDRILKQPQSGVTRELLAAVPRLDSAPPQEPES
ncbi:MAG TPA: dipeptide/oligopeptide/nickel ABC transporter ATP-binding protein [Candidatus Acidoferrum sp.]|nr:dipeptide/oligopeptide/nickel ABC transporter ATP-binding protein [Candidatus Acidoferrum sp.]